MERLHLSVVLKGWSAGGIRGGPGAVHKSIPLRCAVDGPAGYGREGASGLGNQEARAVRCRLAFAGEGIIIITIIIFFGCCFILFCWTEKQINQTPPSRLCR